MRQLWLDRITAVTATTGVVVGGSFGFVVGLEMAILFNILILKKILQADKKTEEEAVKVIEKK